MSIRLLVALLTGVLAMGSGRAFAVSAPGTMDSLPAESRDDLFASKPASPAPAVVSPSPAIELPPAPPSQKRTLSDNPLWEIPLGRLTASRERPLFAPTRRLPAPAPVAMPAPVQAAPPPRPAEPEKPQLSLLGTIVGSETIGLFVDSASKSVIRLKAGENHKGWTLRAVRRHQVELEKGLDSAVLDIPPPDMKVGAPVTALGAPALSAPAAMAASPPSLNPAPSSHVHPGANMNLPINRAGGPQPGNLVAPGAQPAAFKPPQALIAPLGAQGQR